MSRTCFYYALSSFRLVVRGRDDLLRIRAGRGAGDQVQHVERSGRTERRQGAHQGGPEVQSGVGRVAERRRQAEAHRSGSTFASVEHGRCFCFKKKKRFFFVQNANKLTKDGYLVIRSEKTRSQQLNLADAMERLRSLIWKAAEPEKKPSEETVEKMRRR